MLKTRSQTVQGLFVLHFAKDSIFDSIKFNVKQVEFGMQIEWVNYNGLKLKSENTQVSSKSS